MNQNLTPIKEIVSTITSKGQVTIPREVRRHLGVDTKDKVAFILRTDGDVQIRAPRYPNIESLKGAAGSLKNPLTWRQMRTIAHEDRLQQKRLRRQ